ncbi:methyltransferase family protein [Diaminobutyricimonas aerilata]|uniref:Methyltransferase family protein n=1 Tax=Diaminobutyricimonas aerilata TaxID=1162967 RepID=A0A2M9CIW3_9MICO|nr:class I SAM-dependent methyltransferase [Diaminobutyricimonas aerilata]PJJ71822.1 methyltransferase family protein [Diaminobutyricimonas aerilata]
MTDTEARQRWVVDHLDLRGTERVLEFGCGPGVAAALAAGRLARGSLLAVDRSPVAVARARARIGDVPHATIEQTALADLSTPEPFDVAFGVDVNVFWTGTAHAECDALARLLRPGGRLALCFSLGPTGADRIVPRVRAALAGHPFTEPTVSEGPGLLAVDAVRRP